MPDIPDEPYVFEVPGRSNETRAERVERLIQEGDVEKLLARAFPGPCACLGRVDGEPKCRCRMTHRQIGNAVSLFALQRGRLFRLKG